MIKILTGMIILLCLKIPAFADGADQVNQKKFRIGIKKASQQIKLDGILNEPAWAESEIAGSFIQTFPTDTSQAVSPTEIRLTYDQEYLYVAARCEDYEKGDYMINSLRRDFRGSENDGISIVIDPFRDQTMGFFFGLSPFGVTREGIINPGSSITDDSDTDYSWDNKWYAVAKIYDGYWIGEIAIPFSTLRFNENADSWNINFYRIDTKQNERTTWHPIPRGFRLASLAFTGELVWDQPLTETEKSKLSLIPYLSSGFNKDFITGQGSEANFSAGGDVKFAVSPSLNLDLTFNPDFSQVEVDEQVTNLTRFELFFPERRQFFIENSDLFASFGAETVRPFFSRRIGLLYDTLTGQNVPNRILYGARLSGKINDNWRTGLMNIQTANEKEYNLPGQNYAVAILQRKIFAASNISAMFVNRQAMNMGESNQGLRNNYNRVFGLDYNLNSADGFWTGKFFYHRSLTPGLSGQNFAHGGALEYRTPVVRLGWRHQWIGENFNAETGFVPRKNYKRIQTFASYNFFPASGPINRHGPGVEYDLFWNETEGKTDQIITFGYEVFFQNTSRLNFSLLDNYIYLFNDFNLAGTENRLAAGTDYQYRNIELRYQSDKRKAFYYQVRANSGGFFNGRRQGISGDLNLRWQPFGIFSFLYSYNKISMPEPYQDADLILIGPRIDLTLTRNFFFTTFTQYNNQIDNININSRLQWRFKPVSDLFLVYTDNYFPETFQTKNRAIIAKISYWLNM